MTMKDNSNDQQFLYVAIPMENNDDELAPTIFVPSAEITTFVEKSRNDDGSSPRHRNNGTAFRRAAIVLAVGFLVTTLIAFVGSNILHRHPSHFRLRGRGNGGEHHMIKCDFGFGMHHNHHHPAQDRGPFPKKEDAEVFNMNTEETEEYAKEYKMDGWYAGNESHDGWHANAASDDADVSDAMIWMDEKEDGLIPGLP
mmetsp:Transcript_32269/g.68273  ORF Transcript_32269/g.68273 Transcript_32269/m.68273 type:complete len:198 (+) Transcript_32269:92-685(+)|eukprot:CAMPEP_0183705374 /NCGR_PEP_ID=MMETSP0737-20130205/2485_1 /TAXON_ID=385413 /ORGANISM="Thalassiosira miniscula, Strain CCMP1093" /LENGTH=197 /DNA_ID=CAMNT_0025932511 /DNA_START=13 /DNA_END=606 /DNA_ORIENTATION=-